MSDDDSVGPWATYYQVGPWRWRAVGHRDSLAPGVSLGTAITERGARRVAERWIAKRKYQSAAYHHRKVVR